MTHEDPDGADRREQANETSYPFVRLVHERLTDEDAVARSRAFLEGCVRIQNQWWSRVGQSGILLVL